MKKGKERLLIPGVSSVRFGLTGAAMFPLEAPCDTAQRPSAPLSFEQQQAINNNIRRAPSIGEYPQCAKRPRYRDGQMKAKRLAWRRGGET